MMSQRYELGYMDILGLVGWWIMTKLLKIRGKGPAKRCPRMPQVCLLILRPLQLSISTIFSVPNINIIKHSHWSYDPMNHYSPIIPVSHLFLVSQLWLAHQNKHLNRGDEIQIPHTSSTLQSLWTIDISLLGGFKLFLFFHNIWDVILPKWQIYIFQRGRYTTNQSIYVNK